MDISYFIDNELTIRRCERTDVDVVYRWENDPLLADTNSLIEPLAHFQARKLVASGNSELITNGFLLLMAELSAEKSKHTIGMLQVYNYDFFNKRAAVGVVVDTQYQQKGYGERLLKMLVKFLVNEYDVHHIYAEIIPSNVASVRCFEKANFKHTATLPQWIKRKNSFSDLLIYSCFAS